MQKKKQVKIRRNFYYFYISFNKFGKQYLLFE